MIINTSTNFTPAHHKICFQLFYLSFFSAWGTVWMRFCWPCIDYNYFYSCKTSIHPVPTSTSPAWTVLVYALPYPSCTPFFVRFPLNCHTTSGSFQRDSAGAGHSCHRFCLHDRRASYSSQCLDAPAIWCSVFPQSAPWPLEHIV